MPEEIYFTKPEHKQRFVDAIQQTEKLYDDFDPSFVAALYILTKDPNTWAKASGYIGRIGILFPTMLSEQGWSGGMSVMINLAGNLFNNELHINPVELIQLDEGNYRIALTAISLRRYGLKWAGLQIGDPLPGE
jgi:hypothetical protein